LPWRSLDPFDFEEQVLLPDDADYLIGIPNRPSLFIFANQLLRDVWV
jgi:hypothetical protein